LHNNGRKGESLDTVAVSAALIAYNWPKDSDRYRQIEASVELLFPRLAEFQKPPRDPTWREANLAAVLPGWSRFPAAAEWLKCNRQIQQQPSTDEKERIMAVPIPDRDGIDDPLSYAPRWARESPPLEPELDAFADAPPTAPARSTMPDLDAGAAIPDALETGRPRPAPAGGAAAASAHQFARAPSIQPTITATPPMAPGIGGPNIDLPPPRLRPFEGDIAMRDLRRRLSLEPDIVPEPPLRKGGEPIAPWIGRFSLVLMVAAVATLGISLLTLPQAPPQPADGTIAPVTPQAEAPLREQSAAAPARLVVESQRTFANEPLPLGISLHDATGRETVTLVGLAKGTMLTAGTPLGLTGWQLQAREIGNAFAHAPKDFVGIMDAAIDLRSPRDRIMDSQIVRLEWVQRKEARLTPRLDSSKPPPVIQQLDPEEIATLVKRGEDFLKTGDVAAARLFLRRAAAAGHGPAALALGLTFDPAFLAEQGVLGFAPDLAQARSWYERAAELGSREAAQRLERLARRSK
jgi:hypothetical protein